MQLLWMSDCAGEASAFACRPATPDHFGTAMRAFSLGFSLKAHRGWKHPHPKAATKSLRHTTGCCDNRGICV